MMKSVRSIIVILAATMLTSSEAGEWPFAARKGTFQFHADFPLQPTERLIEQLYRQRQEVSQLLKIPPCDEPIDVYLFAKKPTYEQYMRHYFPKVSPRRAMYIKSNSPGNVFAYASPEFDIDLRHEFTHALLHATLPMVPLWLDEGLAEYFEQPSHRRAFDHPYLSQVRRSVRWQRPPSIARLQKMTSMNEMGATEYRNAWAWVHFMVHGPSEAQEVLIEYFQDIQRHQPPDSLADTLRARIPNLERAFANHFKRWQR